MTILDETMRRVLIISSEDPSPRADQLEQGLAACGFSVRRAVAGAGCRSWGDESAPDAALCIGWETLPALGRAPCPVVLDLPVPCLAGESPGPELQRRVQAKLAALRLADYFTCAGRRQRLYFRSWLALAEIPQGDRRLAVVAASPGAGAGAVPEYLAPDEAADSAAAAVAPLAEFLRVAQIQPAPAVPVGAPPPERLKTPRELLAEARYHLRHGGARAVWANSVGFAGKVLRRIFRRK